MAATGLDLQSVGETVNRTQQCQRWAVSKCIAVCVVGWVWVCVWGGRGRRRRRKSLNLISSGTGLVRDTS